MEVIAVASTVCALCLSIQQWIDQLVQREVLIDQISSSVLQIHNILQPFASASYTGTGEYHLAQSIRCVGDVLQRVKEHLIVWKYKRSHKLVAFINPGAQVQKLKDDQTQINNQLIILLTAIATVGYFHNHEKAATSKDSALADSSEAQDSTVVPDTASELSSSTLVPTEDTGYKDALGFWKDFIGTKVELARNQTPKFYITTLIQALKVNFVPNDLFSLRLNTWYQELHGGPLEQKISDRIIMRLDEFNCGDITPNNLARALGSETLENFVTQYVKGHKTISMPEPDAITAPGQQLRTPLLVWIDDCPENNAFEVGQARASGIMVIELSSTALAKAWVEANEAFLRAHDDPSEIRFISDNVRLEPAAEGGTFLNHTAGQNFLHYLRGRNFDTPVLIYTGLTIKQTAYVNTYGSAGSTTYSFTCLGYISSLAARRSDDDSWKGFKGSW